MIFGNSKKRKNTDSVDENARNKFIAELSFSIRNPLNTICGVTEIIKKNLENGCDTNLILSYIDVLVDAQTELQQVIDRGFAGFDTENYSMSKSEEKKEADVDYSVLENLRVMVVEDSSVSQLIAKEMLESRGSIVTTCNNGKEALELFKNSITGTFDVIFMDINMPGMDGYETTDAIRHSGHPQAGSVPIIAMTAEALTEDVQAAMKAGMNAHISKPICAEKIIYAINAMK